MRRRKIGTLKSAYSCLNSRGHNIRSTHKNNNNAQHANHQPVLREPSRLSVENSYNDGDDDDKNNKQGFLSVCWLCGLNITAAVKLPLSVSSLFRKNRNVSLTVIRQLKF